MPQDATVTASTPAGAGAGNATTRPTSATGGGAGGESGSGGPVQGQQRTGPAKDCDAAKDCVPQAGRAAGPGGAAVGGATSRVFVFGAGGGSGGSGGSGGALQGQADAAKKNKKRLVGQAGAGDRGELEPEQPSAVVPPLKTGYTWVDKRSPIWWALENMTAGLTVAGAKVAVDAMDVRRGNQSVSAFILTLDKPEKDWFKELSHSAAP